MARSVSEDGSWEQLATGVIRWRDEYGLSQMDVAARGGLSLDRVQAIEGVRTQGGYRPSTLKALERGLGWAPGSVKQVMAGGEPTPASDADGPVPVPADMSERVGSLGGELLPGADRLPDLSGLSSGERRQYLRDAFDVLPMIQKHFPWLYDQARDDAIELSHRFGGAEGEESLKGHR